MKDYFEEKTRQIEPGDITAFGIPLSSRYAKATDMAEMLMFVHKVASAGLHHHVESVSYDTKACLCVIYLHDEELWFGEAGKQIRTYAKETISQFQWHGTVGHSDEFLKVMGELQG